ncbi:MAG TPA: hypothetical protein VGN96_04000 [Roseococcus sp.]|jgi:hypothetical protein|nr:hypothetical protein [Roseococcus sp.]
MARGFEEVIRLQMRDVASPEFQKRHAAIARQGLAQHLATVEFPPRVRRIVDGRVGVGEEQVKPFGIIRYEFDNLREAAYRAKAELEDETPKRSGRLAGAWFFMVAGRQVQDVPRDATEVTIANDQPYARRLLVGKRPDGRPFNLKHVPPGYLEIAKARVAARFGNSVEVLARFIYIEGGYELKNDYRDPTVSRRRRIRPENRAGQPITYPALVLRLR